MEQCFIASSLFPLTPYFPSTGLKVQPNASVKFGVVNTAGLRAIEQEVIQFEEYYGGDDVTMVSQIISLPLIIFVQVLWVLWVGFREILNYWAAEVLC